MKSRKRNSFLLCFGPPEKYDDEKGERSAGSSQSPGSDVSEERSKMIGRRRGRLAGRALAKFIRSAVFVTSLQKSRVEKMPQDPRHALQRKISDVADEKSMSATCRKQRHEEDSNSDTSLSSTSSSSSSSPSSYLAPEPRLRRERSLPPTPKTPRKNPTIYSTATGLCFLILSLFIMLFCGRLCAILWTSTWLCFLPGRVSSVSPTSGDVAARKKETHVAPSRDLEVYNKKKIILEGLLERNHRF